MNDICVYLLQTYEKQISHDCYFQIMTPLSLWWKREGQRKAKRCTTRKNKKKERVNPFRGRKFSPTAFLMSLACKSWDLIIMRSLEQTSPTNAIFLSIIKAKTCLKTILTHCLKNWMQKDKDKWPCKCLLQKKWAHSLMNNPYHAQVHHAPPWPLE